MNRGERANSILFLSLGLLILSSFFRCSEGKADILTIGTGGSLGNYYRAGRAISRIVNTNQKSHGIQLEVKETEGSVTNIDLIIAGAMEFGIAQSDRQYQAVNGLADWKDRGPQEELRAVFSLYTESVTLVAAKRSGIETIQDIVGKKIDIGHPNSGVRQNSIDALDAAEIDWNKDIISYGAKPDDRIAMYLRGELDAFFHTVGHPSKDLTFVANSAPGARFIALTNIENPLSENPYYSKSIIPIKHYPGADNRQDVETFGLRATVLTSSKIADEIIYAFTKAVFDDYESLGKFDLVLETLTKESMLRGLTAPIHTGALRYYKEVGLEIPPAISGVSAKTGIGPAMKLDLVWDDTSSDETGFIIERKTSAPEDTYKEIARVGANVTRYSDTGLDASTSYYYRVRAFNSDGPSEFSNELFATTRSD